MECVCARVECVCGVSACVCVRARVCNGGLGICLVRSSCPEGTWRK